MKKIALFFSLVCLATSTFAQVKIGDNPTTINGGSLLELESTNKGLLHSRVSLTSTTTWGLGGTSAAGMMVYNTNTSITQGSSTYPTIKGGKGVYYWDGTGWVAIKFEAGDIFINGAGAPSGACSGDVIYVDTLEASPTEGQTWTCSGGTWITYTPKNGTEWMFSGSTNDAGSSKDARIWRKNFVGIATGTAATFSPFTAIHVLNNGNVNGSSDNIITESYGGTGNTWPSFSNYFNRGSRSAPTPVLNADQLGMFSAGTKNTSGSGTYFKTTAFIRAEADGDHTTTSYPTLWRFATTPTGSSDAIHRMVIKENGYVGIGTGTPTSGITLQGENGSTYLDPASGNDIRMIGYSGASGSMKGSLIFESNRGSLASSTATTRLLQSGDALGSIYMGNKDDIGAVYIDGNVPQTWTTTSHPSELALGTTPSGSTTAARRMTIKENGFVGVGTSDPVSLLDLNSSADASATSHGVLSIGAPSSTQRLLFDSNEIMSVNSSGATNTAGGTLIINGSPTTGVAGANTTIGYDGTSYVVTVENTGMVGIGVNPSKAKLEVSGSVATSLAAGQYFNASSGGVVAYAASSQALSIHASARVAATHFLAYSDERIKKDIHTVSGKESVDFINKINIVDYKYKDIVEKGDQLQKGVIAQQVEAIAPEAITMMKGFIPNVYSISTSAVENTTDKTLTVTVGKITDLKAGDKVKLISFNQEKEYEVIAVKGTNTFTVKNWNEKLKDNSVFVYGKEVDDYKSVNYDYLYSANIAATQELYKMIVALKSENASLKNESADIKSALENISKRLQLIETKEGLGQK